MLTKFVMVPKMPTQSMPKPEAIERFRRDGFLVVERLLPEERIAGL